jgi:hypothetical protein
LGLVDLNTHVESMQAPLCDIDPDVAQAIQHEEQRQHDKLVLIASENYASKAVLEAQGSVLTNKYAEGYPKKRYYGGCEYVDVVEQTCHRPSERSCSGRNTPTCSRTRARRHEHGRVFCLPAAGRHLYGSRSERTAAI